MILGAGVVALGRRGPPTDATAAAIPAPAPPAATAGLDTVAFANATVGWAGGGGTILGTTDGGGMWRPAWQGSGQVTSFALAGPSVAYAVTDRALLRTAGPGAPWQAVHEPNGSGDCAADPGADCILSASFPQADIGFAVAALPAFVGTGPQAVAVSPDGRWLYSANISGTVSAYSLRLGRVVWYASSGAAPSGIAVSPDGRRVYVANQNDGTVAVVDTLRRAAIARIRVAPNPCGMALSRNGSQLYVDSASPNGDLSVIDTATDKVVRAIGAGGSCSLAVAAGGDVVLGSEVGPGQGVQVVDPQSGRIVHTFAVGRGPFAALPSPSGTRIYADDPVAGEVDILDASSGTVEASIHVGPLPWGMALSADGSRLYVGVSQAGGKLDVIDTRTGRVAASVALPGNVEGTGMTMAGDALYVAEQQPGVARVDLATLAVSSLVTGGQPTTQVFGPALPLAGGNLYRTADGGEKWARVPAPAPVQSVCFATPETGYIASHTTVYRTTDGGRSWRVAFRAPVRAPAGSLWGAVACWRNTAWLAITGPDAGMGHQAYIVFASQPGGGPWRPIAEENYMHLGDRGVDAPEGPGSYPGPLAVTADGQLVLAGWYPATMAAAVQVPGGAVRGVPDAQQIRALAFPTAQDGWVVTEHGQLLHTADGGRHWVAQVP